MLVRFLSGVQMSCEVTFEKAKSTGPRSQKMTSSNLTQEQKARQEIDALLNAAGWIVQDRAQINLSAGRGIAIREFLMAPGYGEAD
jgi:hypothetical protein